MLKRFSATFLWLFAGWYGGAMLAEAFSVSPVLGPILGITAATMIAIDPLGAIWKRNTDATTVQVRSQGSPEPV
jgi:hypothetical protein